MQKIEVAGREYFPKAEWSEWEMPSKSEVIATLRDRAEKEAVFNSGFYTISNPTAQGKTFTALALALWFARSVSTVFKQINEPRSGVMSQNDLIGLISKTKADVLVVDSLGAILEEASAGQKNDATYAGGLRVGVVRYLRQLQTTAFNANKCLIGVINTSVFPIKNELEGVFEGIVQPGEIGLINKRDRGNRKMESLLFPEVVMAAAQKTLGYDFSSKSKGARLV